MNLGLIEQKCLTQITYLGPMPTSHSDLQLYFLPTIPEFSKYFTPFVFFRVWILLNMEVSSDFFELSEL